MDGFNTEEKQSNYIVSTLVHALFENKKFKEKLENEVKHFLVDSKPNFYSFEEVMDITGLARGTIYLQMKEGTFPQSIKLGKKRVVWTPKSIQEWVDNLVKNNE